MTTTEWMELFQRMPTEMHGALLVGLSNGCEFSVQDVLRIDEQFLLVRGRIGGTNESGRVFCIPYDRLTYFMLTRDFAEAKVKAVFGELLVSLIEKGPRDEEAAADETEGDAEAAVTEAPIPEVAAPSPLRDRLRARLASGVHAPGPKSRVR
jgi:hypothetical protein